MLKWFGKHTLAAQVKSICGKDCLVFCGVDAAIVYLVKRIAVCIHVRGAIPPILEIQALPLVFSVCSESASAGRTDGVLFTSLHFFFHMSIKNLCVFNPL